MGLSSPRYEAGCSEFERTRMRLVSVRSIIVGFLLCLSAVAVVAAGAFTLVMFVRSVGFELLHGTTFLGGESGSLGFVVGAMVTTGFVRLVSWLWNDVL